MGIAFNSLSCQVLNGGMIQLQGILKLHAQNEPKG